MKTTLLILLLLLSGCVQRKPVQTSPRNGWSAIGWETNTMSLDPVTNMVPFSAGQTNRPVLRQDQ